MYYNKQKGDEYEYTVLKYLKTRKDEYDEVWLNKEIPLEILEATNLKENIKTIINYKECDIGFDILGLKDNEYYFIQCKNYKNTLCINDLCSFYFLLYEYNLKGVIYYSGELSKRLLELNNNNVKYCYLNMNNIRLDLDLNMNLKKEIEYRQYQYEAYEMLKNEQRSIISIPCGMGKTYIGYLLSRNYKNIILITPTRVLTEELLNRFYQYYDTKYNPILLSMDGELDINKLTIANNNIIGTTYKSVNILNDLLKDHNLENKLFIFDEYHNLSLNNLENEKDDIGKILNNKENNILFLSATPIKHNYFENIKTYNYKWTDAIKNKYICDMKIIIPNKKELPEKIINDFIDLFNNPKLNKDVIIQIYFIIKNIIENKNKKLIIYVSYCDQIYEYEYIINIISKFFNIKSELENITYYTSRRNRKRIIEKFKKPTDNYSILLNVSILNEGVDIPDCDSIFITNNTDNMINTVQRMSRCNRITKTKNECYIYLWTDQTKIEKIYEYMNMDNLEFIKSKIKIKNMSEQKEVKKKLSFTEYFLKNSNIDIEYHNEILKIFENLEKLDSKEYLINHEKLREWLKLKHNELFRKNIKENYIETKDYIITYPQKNQKGGQNKQILMLTIDTALKLSMNTGKRGQEVSNYFIELNKALLKYKDLLMED